MLRHPSRDAHDAMVDYYVDPVDQGRTTNSEGAETAFRDVKNKNRMVSEGLNFVHRGSS